MKSEDTRGLRVRFVWQHSPSSLHHIVVLPVCANIHLRRRNA